MSDVQVSKHMEYRLQMPFPGHGHLGCQSRNLSYDIDPLKFHGPMEDPNLRLIVQGHVRGKLWGSIKLRIITGWPRGCCPLRQFPAMEVFVEVFLDIFYRFLDLLGWAHAPRLYPIAKLHCSELGSQIYIWVPDRALFHCKIIIKFR